MSGLFGWSTSASPREPGPLLARMQRSLAHRGPDGARTFLGEGGRAALGQCHLDSFAPPGAPASPALAFAGARAAAVDGPVVVRRSRERAADPAAEVLSAHGRHGASFASELEGPHAIAVLDGSRVHLSRDALGEKPLYVHAAADGSTLVFGSEIKALLEHPAVPREVDPEGLGLYLTFGWIPSPRTLFRGVEKLAPGESLEWAPGGGVTRRRHWRLPPVEPAEGGRRAFAAEAEEVLVRAVESRVRGLDEVGVFLSGGMDSTILIVVLRELGIRRIRTFTLGLPNDRRQERDLDLAYARLVAERYGTDHHELDLRGGLDPNELLPALMAAYDDPILSPNAATKYLLAGLARRHGVASILTGSGAGGACGPYRRFRDPDLRRKMMKKIDGLEDDVARFLRLRGKVIGLGAQRELVGPGRALTPERLEAALSPVLAEAHLDEYPRAYVLANLLLTIPEKASAVLDRSGHLASVDVASPYLDRELVELQMRLPSSFDGGRTYTGVKCLLTDAFRDRLPPEVLDRPETGFPSYFWHQGELDLLGRRLLAPEALRRAGLFEPAAVQRVLAEEAKDESSKTSGKRAWALIQVSLWHAVHVRREREAGVSDLSRVSEALLSAACR